METKTLFAAMFGASLIGAVLHSHAQGTKAAPSAPAWPAKTVTFVVPSTPGSAVDLVTRTLATDLSKKWGQSVIVENKPGATSMIGNAFVAKSPPDGYTLLSGFTALVQIPSLVKDVPYDVEKDLVAVTHTVSAQNMLVVRADSPYRTMRDFIAAAKTANPPLSYGTTGTGNMNHVRAETMSRGAGIKLAHIPYKGESAAVGDVLGGHLTSAFVSVATGVPLLKANKLRALGVALKTRSQVLPDVPAFAELGLPLPDIDSWFGILAPAGTPPAVVRKVAADVREALTRPETLRLLHNQGLTAVASTPESFAERIHGEVARWKQLLPELGITPK